jgi:hypothetical protein
MSIDRKVTRGLVAVSLANGTVRTPSSNYDAWYQSCKWHSETRPPNYLEPWPLTYAFGLMSLQSTLESMSNKKAKNLTKKYGELVVHPCIIKHCWQEVGSIGRFYCHEEVCDHTLSE